MSLLDLLNFGQPKGIESLADMLKTRYGLLPAPKYTAFHCRWRKEGVPCTQCAEVCPRELYPEDRKQMPDLKACMHCGICAASCPDKCLGMPVHRAERFLLEEARTGELKAACRKAESASGLTVECLAALSMEQMAFAALGDGLELDMRCCADCDVDRWRQELEQRLTELRSFLGEEQFARSVRVLRGQEDLQQKQDMGVSRRDLFLSLREMPLDRVAGNLPELSEQRENGLLFRAMLRDRIRQKAEAAEGEKPRYRVRLPIFSDACWHCGTCEWKCPTRALKLTNTDAGILATIEPWKCTACGVCIRECKEKAITGLGYMKVTNLDRVALRRIPSYPCKDCGKPRPKASADGLCDKCRGSRVAAERRAKLQSKE